MTQRLAFSGVMTPCSMSLRAVEGHQRADLIAGEQFEFAGHVAHRDAHAVAIRIGGDDEVRVFAFRERDGHRERVGVLGIRRCDRREPAVEAFLLGHGEVAEAELVEHRFRDDAAGAVDCGEDNLQPALRSGGDHLAVEDSVSSRSM